jgi:hypothetical protein
MKTLSHPEAVPHILDRLAKVTPQSARQWGRMTPHGMICHCSDSFRCALGELEVSPATSFFNRHVVKYIALCTPVPWPKGVPTRPEVEQGVGGTPPGSFERDREELIDLIRRFASSRFEQRAPHPVFGPMSPELWMRWGYQHMDHHLRQFGA